MNTFSIKEKYDCGCIKYTNDVKDGINGPNWHVCLTHQMLIISPNLNYRETLLPGGVA